MTAHLSGWLLSPEKAVFCVITLVATTDSPSSQSILKSRGTAGALEVSNCAPQVFVSGRQDWELVFFTDTACTEPPVSSMERRTQPPLPAKSSTATCMSPGGVQATRRYCMVKSPRAGLASLAKLRDWTSMWSASHWGHSSAIEGCEAEIGSQLTGKCEDCSAVGEGETPWMSSRSGMMLTSNHDHNAHGLPVGVLVAGAGAGALDLEALPAAVEGPRLVELVAGREGGH